MSHQRDTHSPGRSNVYLWGCLGIFGCVVVPPHEVDPVVKVKDGLTTSCLPFVEESGRTGRKSRLVYSLSSLWLQKQTETAKCQEAIAPLLTVTIASCAANGRAWLGQLNGRQEGR